MDQHVITAHQTVTHALTHHLALFVLQTMYLLPITIALTLVRLVTMLIIIMYVYNAVVIAQHAQVITVLYVLIIPYYIMVHVTQLVQQAHIQAEAIALLVVLTVIIVAVLLAVLFVH